MSDRGEETRDCGNENRKDIRYRLEDLRRIINDAFLILIFILETSVLQSGTFCPDDFSLPRRKTSPYNFDSDCQEYKKAPSRVIGREEAKRDIRAMQLATLIFNT